MEKLSPSLSRNYPDGFPQNILNKMEEYLPPIKHLEYTKEYKILQYDLLLRINNKTINNDEALKMKTELDKIDVKIFKASKDVNNNLFARVQESKIYKENLIQNINEKWKKIAIKIIFLSFFFWFIAGIYGMYE